MKRVLFTSIGATSAISGAKSLRHSQKNAYYIAGTDCNDPFEIPAETWCDAVYKVPLFHDDSYIKSMLEICKKERIEYLIPVIDPEVEVLARHSKEFAKHGTTIITSPAPVVTICNDKYKTWKQLHENGIKTPRVFLPQDPELLRLKTSNLFIKPRAGVSSLDSYLMRGEEEFMVFSKRVKDPVYQEVLHGDQYVVDILNDRRGKTVIAAPRCEYAAKSGLGVKAETVHDPSLTSYATTIAEALGIQGIANIEVFKSADTISFIEINPRLSAGAILTTHAGINLPELAIELFSNHSIDPKPLHYKSGVYMTRYWQEAFHERT